MKEDFHTGGLLFVWIYCLSYICSEVVTSPSSLF